MKCKMLFLVAATVLSLAACGNNDNKKSEVIGHEEDITRYTFKGVHDFDYQESDSYIVKNKVSSYKIVLPNNPSAQIIKAKEELKNLFCEATGVNLEEITEDPSGLVHDENNEYISLGDTKLLESSGLKINKEELGVQASRILTLDKTIFLSGGDDVGVIFSVYNFLEILFNFDACAYDCVHLDKKDDVKFYTMDITDIPDIPYRSNSWAFIEENPNNLAYRLRTPYSFSDYFLSAGDTSVPGVNRGAIHNSLNIIPKNSVQGVLHKDTWFSDNGDQICYTAHGDKQSYQELVNQSALIIEDSLKLFTPASYPNKNYVSFTMMDNHNVCSCAACKAEINKYGTASGSVIKFCNALMAKLREWMDDPLNAEYNRPDLKLVFFAYNEFIFAPAHYDESAKKYVPNHEDVKMRNDVGVYYAVSSGFNYQKNIYDEGCKEGLTTYRQWCDIAPATLLWTYNANFGGYLSHVNSTNFYNTDAYQAFAQGNVTLLYNQGAWNSYNLTAYQMLAIYLDAKLSWNSNADINALIDRYFSYMYENAAEEMKELYYQENMYAMIMYESLGVLDSTGIINKPVQTTKCYPFQTLKAWLNIIEKARKKIEPYRDVDYDKFKMIKEHIDLEWVSPAYFMLAIYGKDYLSLDEYNSMLNYFVDEILPLKQFLISERSGSLSAWITQLVSGN